MEPTMRHTIMLLLAFAAATSADAALFSATVTGTVSNGSYRTSETGPGIDLTGLDFETVVLIDDSRGTISNNSVNRLILLGGTGEQGANPLSVKMRVGSYSFESFQEGMELDSSTGFVATNLRRPEQSDLLDIRFIQDDFEDIGSQVAFGRFFLDYRFSDTTGMMLDGVDFRNGVDYVFGDGGSGGGQFSSQYVRSDALTSEILDFDVFTVFVRADRIVIAPVAVPEPATWATMIGGFALVGGALRRRRVDGLGYA
jgi:hypothetical protein